MDEKQQSTTSIDELRQRLAEQEQAEIEACLRQIQSLAEQLGFEIVGVPRLAGDGRIIADWGIRRKAE